jgi:hypothetical protein
MIRRFANNELVLKQADSAKVQVDPAEITQMHASFLTAVSQAWSQLGITPSTLQDSAKSQGDREKLVARRVDEYFSRMIAQAAPFVAIPTPVANVLRQKFGYSFNDAGFDRAVEQASKVRNTADSAHSAGQPQTAVPINPATPPAASSTAPSGKK